MFSRSEALQIALTEAPTGLTVRERDAIELSNGWYFPWRIVDGQDYIGSHGLIVNKQSGEALHLGSAFSAERDWRAYEAGMTQEAFDIRIDRIVNLESTLAFVEAVGPLITRDEVRACLSTLPHTFEYVVVYFVFEAIEAARANGCCEFTLVDPRHRAETT